MSGDFSQWFDVAVTCAQHPATEARAACERCGVFRCEHCLDAGTLLCDACTVIVSRERLPTIARGVAWKLALAPAFALFSVAMLAAQRAEIPPTLLVWVVPVGCAFVVVRRASATAAWLGVASSLALLGWQGWMTAAQAEWLRLTDVGMLAIAPVVAIGGSARLARLRARVDITEASVATA